MNGEWIYKYYSYGTTPLKNTVVKLISDNQNEISNYINYIMDLTGMSYDEVVKLHDESQCSYKEIYDMIMKELHIELGGMNKNE